MASNHYTVRDGEVALHQPRPRHRLLSRVGDRGAVDCEVDLTQRPRDLDNAATQRCSLLGAALRGGPDTTALSKVSLGGTELTQEQGTVVLPVSPTPPQDKGQGQVLDHGIARAVGRGARGGVEEKAGDATAFEGGGHPQ